MVTLARLTRCTTARIGDPLDWIAVIIATALDAGVGFLHAGGVGVCAGSGSGGPAL